MTNIKRTNTIIHAIQSKKGHAAMRLLLVCTLLLSFSCKTRTTSALNDTEVASTGEQYPGPPGQPSPEENQQVWQLYCVSDLTNPSVIPGPKYDNPEVIKAAQNLSLIDPHSFALYSAIRYHYKNTPIAKPEAYTKSAHEFLTYLCGEFRDRATMVQAKIRWLHNFVYLPKSTQPQINPRKKNVWLQVTAESYRPYLDFSRTYFAARKAHTEAQGKLTFGQFAHIDRPIPAQTICETKFIFAEYIDES
jgi:hypothetical protein